jgi:hypothetical protein
MAPVSATHFGPGWPAVRRILRQVCASQASVTLQNSEGLDDRTIESENHETCNPANDPLSKFVFFAKPPP